MFNGQHNSQEQKSATDGKRREVVPPVFSELERALVMRGKLADWEHVGLSARMLTMRK